MKFTVKSFIAGNGERFSQIYSDVEAFPLFYPTAFIARHVRLRTTSDTQKVYLEAIKRLCEWEVQNNINLAVRFQQQKFLLPHEIDGLVKHLNASRRGRAGQTISESKGNTYISYAAQYLTWLANDVITDANHFEVKTLIEVQQKRLVDKQLPKTGSKCAKDRELLSRCLSDQGRKQLQTLWDSPFCNVFRSADRGSRLRTVIMLRILYETGMRRGELLSLKLKNLLESTGGISARLEIERNHHDEYDTRIAQPVAKTAGRIVPLTMEAERQLLEYITSFRADVPNVGFDDEDFIFVTHRAGRGQGKPLSISNADQALASLKKTFSSLRGLHFHLLRHDWNYRFSKAADELNLASVKEEELRRLLMGWSDSSEMPSKYNLRHVQEEGSLIGLQVAGDTRRPSVPPETQTDPFVAEKANLPRG